MEVIAFVLSLLKLVKAQTIWLLKPVYYIALLFLTGCSLFKMGRQQIQCHFSP